jgi:hypothetical protein
MCIKISHAALVRALQQEMQSDNCFADFVQKHLINQEEEEEEEEVKRFSRDLNSACMHACCKRKARKW